MVDANAGLTGNCLRCHSNGYSPGFGMNVILGIRTILPDSTIVHCNSLLSMALSNLSRVPLHRPCLGLMFLRSINGILGFKVRLCCGNPFGRRVFRYSVLNLKASLGLERLSALLILTPSPGNQSCIMSLSVSTSLFVGARMDLPSSHPGVAMFWENFSAEQFHGLCLMPLFFWCVWYNFYHHAIRNRNQTIPLISISNAQCPFVKSL